MAAPTGSADPPLGLIDGLVQLSFAIQAVLGHVAAGYDLSIIQIRLMGIVRDREIGMQALAHYLNLDKSSVTGLVDRATRRGLVQRITIPEDGRVVRVVLTEHGRQIAQRLEEAITIAIAERVEGLSIADRNQLSDLASHIVGKHVALQAVDRSPNHSIRATTAGK